MRVRILLRLLALPVAMLSAQTFTSDPSGVLSQLTVARFLGSGSQSIQAMTSDSAGNLYVAGTTSSPDLPMRNAAQPSIGEALLMRSVDRGLTWQKLSNPPERPVTITPHPAEPQTLLVGSPGGIYKTTNGGRTWRHLYAWDPPVSPSEITYPAGDCCFNIAIDPANPRNVYVYVNTGYGFGQFLASGDGGESWRASRVPSPLRNLSSAKALWVDPNGSGLVGLGLDLSRDHGLIWNSMTSPPMWAASFTVPDPRHAGWIYAATAAGTGGLLYLSKDWGMNWTERPSPRRDGMSQAPALNDLNFDLDLPNTLYTSDVFGSAYASDDGGASWHASRGAGDIGTRQALLSRQCMGGALLAVSGKSVVSSLDFGTTLQPAQLSRVVQLATGPGCAVYAGRSMAGDAFIAKFAPGGSEMLWSTFLGGSDLDAPVALELDDQGNVYVAGNTASADFPITAPRTGSQGRQNAFAVKLDSDGKLIYSGVVGGEASDNVTGLAVNSQGEAHVVGWTNSKSFPVTLAAFQTQPGAADGFAVKLGSEGVIAYASYLPNFVHIDSSPSQFPTPRMVAVAVEASGSTLIGGFTGTLYRMTLDGSTLAPLSHQAGAIYTMETDPMGGIYIAGQTTGAGSGPCFQGYNSPSLPAGDIFVTRLQPDTLEQVYSARIAGDCQSRPGALRIGPAGEVTLGVWTFGSFPLRNPVLSSRTCNFAGAGSVAVARFSVDGSNVLFSSYLDMCSQAPAVALALDGSVYAGVKAPSHSDPVTAASVLRIPVAPSGGILIAGAANAFSGLAEYASHGMLLTITGQKLAPEFLDLGLTYPNPLPTRLGGVQVFFDGVPAEMFQVASDHVICVVPDGVEKKISSFVQVVSGSGTATAFALLTSFEFEGLLTRSFPNFPQGIADGNVRNADGTLNDAQHPAQPGSTVTFFATGLDTPGATTLLWNAPPPQRYELLRGLPATARHAPNLINAVYAIDFQIPDSPTPGVLKRNDIGRVGSGVGVWVK